MRNILLLVLATVCMVSCAEVPLDPIREAVKAEALKSLPVGDVDFRFVSFEKRDSTVFRTEFERREKVFNAWLESNRTLLAKYNKEGKVKNASLKSDDVRRDVAKMAGLAMIRDRMERSDSLDVVAYYDYEFTAVAKVGGHTYNFDHAWCTVTPEFKVISLTSDKRDLHKTTGRAIPGYSELLRGEE